MGLIMKFTITLFMSISLICHAEAAWQEPISVVDLGWGRQPGQVAIRYGDTEDSFPNIFQVDQDGNILIADSGNVRLLIFSSTGTLIKSIGPVGLPVGITGWPLGFEIFSGPKILIKRGDKYQIYNYDGSLIKQFSGVATYIDEIVVLPDDSIVVYKSDEKKYYQYSPTGQLLKTSTERPLELGRVSEQSLGEGRYKTTVRYPDKIYSFIGGPFEFYVRDSAGHLNAVSGKFVKKISECGKELGRLSLPKDQSKIVQPGGGGFDEVRELIAEYGSPVIAPNGDVYTWKRTPDKYSILKWTWVDDPNVPTGPDAPSELKVTPAINGLYLTWKASPQDPGCVTGYEVARATASGGVYSTIATVDKGMLKYNDTTANVGTQYYYKVRAMAGKEYSPYTSEVTGKR